MEGRYDLFELAPYGFPQWVDSATNIPDAIEKMRELSTSAGGEEYLVRDFYSGTVVAHNAHSSQSIAIPTRESK
jgi:hypothetical protein